MPVLEVRTVSVYAQKSIATDVYAYPYRVRM